MQREHGDRLHLTDKHHSTGGYKRPDAGEFPKNRHVTVDVHIDTVAMKIAGE